MKTTFTPSFKCLTGLSAPTKSCSTIFLTGAVKKNYHITLLLFTVLFYTEQSKANFTVPAGTIVRADTITAYSGVLTINGTLNLSRNTVLSGFTSVIINAPSGQIYWTNNSDLTFAAGTSIAIRESALGLRPGGGNSSQRLWVGATLMAVANNNSGPAALSFADMNAAGGLPEFTIAMSAVSLCYGTALTATLMPLNTNISYDCTWSVDNGAGISPATVSNFNTAKVATISPVNAAVTKVYTISCKLYKTGDGDVITTKTISITVNPSPAVPNAVAVSPSAICLGAAANLIATSAGNTIEWFTDASGGVAVGTSASAVNYILSPAKTTSYYAGALTASTGCRSSSRVSAGIVDVSQPSVGGITGGAAIVCTGMNNNSIVLSNYAGFITGWQSSEDNFTTVKEISINSDTLITSNINNTTYYRAVVTNGVCPSAISNTTVLTVSNTGKWLGVNTDWNSGVNWCNGSVPLSTTNISIDSGLLYYPEINGSVIVNDISIAPGALVKVKATGTLTITGSVSSKQGIDARQGTIEMAGASPQAIHAADFVSNTIDVLTVSNTMAGASAANPSVEVAEAGGMLKVSGTISFGNTNNALLHTNDQLTLLSAAARTASIADITNNNINSNNTIAGRVVIERYIPARRAWRFLTVPVTPESNVTISEAWQEGARVTDPAASTASTNPAPGYGTHVSYGSPVAGMGYDLNINGNTSIKYFTATGSNGIPFATNSGNITDQPAYLLFIRGDRSTQLSLGTNAPATPTVLRVKGFINTGQTNVMLPPGFKSGSSNFRVFGNPYAAAIDFHKIVQNPVNLVSGFPDAFYMWDAKLGGKTGTGSWVAFSYNSSLGRYDKSVSSAVDASGAIQSGSAVLIDYSGAAENIQVRESDKSAGSNISMFRTAALLKNIRTSLLGKNDDGTTSIIDAAMVSFDDYNSNGIDKKDMRKMENFEESFSLMTDENPLAIERRKPIVQMDTIFYHMTKMKQRSYQLLIEMESVDLPQGTTLYLEDIFLNTRTAVNINATSVYDFNVDNHPLSAASGRFRLVFATMPAFVANRLHTLDEAITNSNKQGTCVFPNPVISNTVRLQLNETLTGTYNIRLLTTAGELIAGKVIYYTGEKAIYEIEPSRNILNGSYRLQIIRPDRKITILNVIVQKK